MYRCRTPPQLGPFSSFLGWFHLKFCEDLGVRHEAENDLLLNQLSRTSINVLVEECSPGAELLSQIQKPNDLHSAML